MTYNLEIHSKDRNIKFLHLFRGVFGAIELGFVFEVLKEVRLSSGVEIRLLELKRRGPAIDDTLLF